MKRWQVVGVIVMLVVVSVVGLYLQRAVSDRSYSGNWGTTAGRGFDVYNVPLDPEYGSYVRFEVTSADGRTVDVYLTDMDGLRAARSNDPFEYDNASSATNVDHISRELRISGYSQLVVMSHDPDEIVSVTSSTEQSSYPLGLMPILKAAGLACWIANFVFFVLLLQSWWQYSRERRAGGH
jgi:hypothetical protein